MQNRFVSLATLPLVCPCMPNRNGGGVVAVDSSIFKGKGLFALKIKGDSMKDAAILDGDLVICEPRQLAENGEIVVALINHEDATVKRFYIRNNRIELKPENPAYQSTFYPFNEILIQGKVVGVI